MTNFRKQDTLKIRNTAAAMAADRVHPEHKANGDEQRYASASYGDEFHQRSRTR